MLPDDQMLLLSSGGDINSIRTLVECWKLPKPEDTKQFLEWLERQGWRTRDPPNEAFWEIDRKDIQGILYEANAGLGGEGIKLSLNQELAIWAELQRAKGSL